MLAPNQPVEVLLNMGPLGSHWRTGYNFVEYEAEAPRVPFQTLGPTCLVEHTSGPFAGVQSRYLVSQVRPVKL